MPVWVACPKCGWKELMAETVLGMPVRCRGCQYLHNARAAFEQHSPGATPYQARPLPPGVSRNPFCPRCCQPVSWEASACPLCGEEFEPEADPGPHGRPLPRRDAIPHRGPLLATLGNICLVAGGLSVCCGVGGIISVPLGIVTLVLASNDLERMRTGTVDHSGKEASQTARSSAVLGIALGVLFAGCYAIWWLGRW